MNKADWDNGVADNGSYKNVKRKRVKTRLSYKAFVCTIEPLQSSVMLKIGEAPLKRRDWLLRK